MNRMNGTRSTIRNWIEIFIYKQQMQRMFISRLNFQSIFESIIKKSDITDTRYKFY